MALAIRIALGFAIFRGFQLALFTVPWLLHKLRAVDVTEGERSLVLMVGSRSVLLGVALCALGLLGRREPLGWVLAADGLLQLFDALHALSVGKRSLAILPAVLCVLDGWASVTLLG